MRARAGSVVLCIIAISIGGSKSLTYIDPPVIVHGTLASHPEYNLVLNCTAYNSTRSSVNVTWTRRTSDRDIPLTVGVTMNTTGSIIVSSYNTGRKRNYDDVGIYNCKITSSSGSTLNHTLIPVHSAPHPSSKHLHRLKEHSTQYYRGSAVAAQDGDDAVTVACQTNGFPNGTDEKNITNLMTITWYLIRDENEEKLIDAKLDTRLNNGSGDGRHVVTNSNGRPNSTLIIRNVQMSDRGYYLCITNNSVDPPLYIYTLVRVKNRLAPLWPVLTLLGEFLLLGLIIGLCELRRKRSAKEEDDIAPKPIAAAPKATVASAAASTSNSASGGDARKRAVKGAS